MGGEFTVVLRGKTFTLYLDQIEFDAPNYFTHLFLGDYVEADTRRVELSRSPELFAIIVEYMSGYAILPLKKEALPPTMSLRAARENLRRDAEFYQLDGLVEVLLRADGLPDRSFPHDAFSLAQREAVAFEDLLRDELPVGVTIDERGVGCVCEELGGDWRPVVIVGRGIHLVLPRRFDTICVAISDPIKARLFKRGPVVAPPQSPGRIVDRDGIGLVSRTHTLDGRTANLMATSWTNPSGFKLGTNDLSGHKETIHEVLRYTMNPPGPAPLPDSIVTVMGDALNAAYDDEAKGSVLVCTKLVFTIGPNVQLYGRSDAGLGQKLGFRILRAECVVRSSALPELIESLENE